VVAVIPAYNEEDTIRDVVERTSEYVDRVVVVDDGSDDETPEIARESGAHVIQHSINMGVGGAQRTGYRYAIDNGYDLVVQIDADGQHDPDMIPLLLEEAEDCEMVIGSRYLNESYKEYGWVRNAGIKFFTSVVNILGKVDITDVTSGYRVYDVHALKDLIYESDKHWAVEQTLEAARQGKEIKEISIKMPPRDEGESQFDIETLLMYPVRMVDIILRIIIFR
jgi:glycosyltransferase involved in cell wall biosynthesis